MAFGSLCRNTTLDQRCAEVLFGDTKPVGNSNIRVARIVVVVEVASSVDIPDIVGIAPVS